MKTAPAAIFASTPTAEPLALSEEVLFVHVTTRQESRMTLAAALVPFTNSVHCNVPVQILRLPGRQALAEFASGTVSAHTDILAVIPGIEKYLSALSTQMFRVGVRFAQQKVEQEQARQAA